MSAIVGVQGAAGSFSETAGQTFIKTAALADATIAYLIRSENVLAAVENGSVDYGIFAIENSRGGVVTESIYALANHNCEILTLFHIKISQNLLVLPGTTLTDITEIQSHEQALRQCQLYLAKHLSTCPQIEADDTAAAAKRLAEGLLPATVAVIGNALCAKLYGLELLAQDIQDLENNITLFAAVRKR